MWLNDGSGHFTLAENAIPVKGINGSCVKAADFDRDGDLDLFVGSRVTPAQYPLAEKSFLLENQSEDGKVIFVDATAKLQLDESMGMVSDAIWSDLNNDFWPDLIVVGEWTPIRFFINTAGVFEEQIQSGIEDKKGWWHSISAADLDHDGDMDYIAGNMGKNTFLNATQEEPVTLIAKDFDQNGSIDPFLSYYLRDSLGTRRDYIYHPWEDVVKQYRGLRKSFNSYGNFGEATMKDIFKNEDLSDAIIKEANWMSSSWIENLGSGKFVLHALPKEAQWAPVYGIVSMDVNADTYPDLILVGNDYGMEVHQGRSDALNGLVLKNNGGKDFEPLTLDKTGFFVGKDAKSLVRLHSANDIPLFVASQNNDSLEVYRPNLKLISQSLQWKQDEIKCHIVFNAKDFQVYERYSTTGFQSQSSTRIPAHSKALRYDFFDIHGKWTRSEEIP